MIKRHVDFNGDAMQPSVRRASLDKAKEVNYNSLKKMVCRMLVSLSEDEPISYAPKDRAEFTRSQLQEFEDDAPRDNRNGRTGGRKRAEPLCLNHPVSARRETGRRKMV